MRTVITALMLATVAAAQQYVISTYAGGAPIPTPAPAASVNLGYIGGMTIDADGNVYFSSGSSLFKLDRTGTLNPIAGNGRPGYSGDGGPAINAQLLSPTGIAVDTVGNVYSGDWGRVRRIAPSGVVTSVAGAGSGVFAGDGGPAVAAGISPSGIAVDPAGNIFIADIRAGRIRQVTPDGVITTIAGNGTCCSFGDGGPALNAAIPYPTAIALDSKANLFVASIANVQLVRRISPDGTITTVAGGGNDTVANGVLATNASLYYPLGLDVDSAGNLYIADLNRVRKVSPDGMITTVAGNGSCCSSGGDGGPAIQAQLSQPTDVTLDPAGNLFVADFGNSRVRKISPAGIITTAAGNGAYCAYPLGCPSPGDGGPATQAELFCGVQQRSGPEKPLLWAKDEVIVDGGGRATSIGREVRTSPEPP
jgi:hypothetical protein